MSLIFRLLPYEVIPKNYSAISIVTTIYSFMREPLFSTLGVVISVCSIFKFLPCLLNFILLIVHSPWPSQLFQTLIDNIDCSKFQLLFSINCSAHADFLAKLYLVIFVSPLLQQLTLMFLIFNLFVSSNSPILIFFNRP